MGIRFLGKPSNPQPRHVDVTYQDVDPLIVNECSQSIRPVEGGNHFAAKVFQHFGQ